MERNLKKEAEFSLDKSCFEAQITDSNLKEDRRLLPAKFIRSDGLKKGSKNIILTDEGGRTWTLKLGFKESFNTFYMSVGWRSFCHENGLEPGDSIMFRLDGCNKKAPVLYFSSSSLNENRFVKRKVTPANLKYRRLDLPRSFTRVNKMAEAPRMHLSDGIIDFFNVVGVKEYESFIMELVWEDRTTLPMLMFCSKNKI